MLNKRKVSYLMPSRSSNKRETLKAANPGDEEESQTSGGLYR